MMARSSGDTSSPYSATKRAVCWIGRDIASRGLAETDSTQLRMMPSNPIPSRMGISTAAATKPVILLCFFAVQRISATPTGTQISSPLLRIFSRNTPATAMRTTNPGVFIYAASSRK